MDNIPARSPSRRKVLVLTTAGLMVLLLLLIARPYLLATYHTQVGGRLLDSARLRRDANPQADLLNAINHFEKALGYLPSQSYIHRQLGRAYLQLGEFDRGIAELQTFSTKRPDHPLGRIDTAQAVEANTLGEACCPTQQQLFSPDFEIPTDAAQAIRDAWEAAGYPPSTWGNEAEDALRKGEYASAWAWFRRDWLSGTTRGNRSSWSQQIENGDFSQGVREVSPAIGDQPGIQIPNGWAAFTHRGEVQLDWVQIDLKQGEAGETILEIKPRKAGLDLVIASQPVAVFKAGDYLGKVEARIENPGTEGKLEIQFLTMEGAPIALKSGTKEGDPDGWQTYQLTGTVPEGAAWMVLRLRILGGDSFDSGVLFRFPTITVTDGEANTGVPG